MSFEHNPTLYFLEHPQEESVLVISKICIKMDQVGDLATKCPTDKRPHQSGDRLHCATHTLPYIVHQPHHWDVGFVACVSGRTSLPSSMDVHPNGTGAT